MNTRGCRQMCAGNQQKTSFCPSMACSKSWSGDPRKVNQLKKMHIKLYPFIDNIERQTYLQNKSLKQISSGISRTEYVDANNKTILDPKKSVTTDITNAYDFLRIMEKIDISEKRKNSKNE